ncbi:MAG: hypothetical protein JW940_11770 [Polyangiaceae bacterium]|nr:hypothetical protein [Polyangiaceae bacterium]
MADAGETAPEGQNRSAEDSSHQACPPSTSAGIGKGTIIAAVIALLIGVVCGFTMSTVGLR